MQCDQRMNATCNASVLREDLSESIRDIYGHQKEALIFQHHNTALHRVDLTENVFRQEYITSAVSSSKL